QWLRLIATYGAAKAVLVPGGGPFADAVREAQEKSGFGEHTAHRMALLAMEQFGLMLCGLQSGLVPAGSGATIRSAFARGEVPVWMPSTMVLSDPSIPESWEVTSDSLSAWLASRLDASTLVLVKSVRLTEPQPPVEEWAARGWVDSGFPQFVTGGHFRLRLLGPGEEEQLKHILLSGSAAAPAGAST
ncbi:MAG: aspartate kinase, partial [Burkholderiales bacterium]